MTSLSVVMATQKMEPTTTCDSGVQEDKSVSCVSIKKQNYMLWSTLLTLTIEIEADIWRKCTCNTDWRRETSWTILLNGRVMHSLSPLRHY